jgi:Subtilase family
MPTRLFLLFPSPSHVDRAPLGGGGSRVVTPTPAQQRQRLETKFRDIAASIRTVQPTTQGLEPEQVIVLETLGDSIEKLAEAAGRIPGLEWLAELDLEDEAPSDGFQLANNATTPLSHRLYALMTNQTAMDQLLTLWQAWLAAPQTRAKKGFGPFKDLFIHLKDVRRWGPQDRLAETQVVENWRADLQAQATAPVRFEAELWYRSNAQARLAAHNQLRALVESEQGIAIRQAHVDAIRYHGAILEMPSDAVNRMLQAIDRGQFTDLLKCEGVMFFRPLAQARFPLPADQDRYAIRQRAASPMPVRPPRVAILDGAPLQRHTLLDGRIVLDDPEQFGARYQPSQQLHGTAMASLVVHGDLSEDDDALDSSVYIRPVLTPAVAFSGEVYEQIPPDELIVDLIHRSVRRIVAELEETRSSVRVINFSIGDVYKPFIREVSPLARLLDWLAWEYKLLFLVSAGNQVQPIQLPMNADAFQRLPDEQAIQTVLRAIADDQPARRHLSPAEAINAVTVGAIHTDGSQRLPQDRRSDLLRNPHLPSPIATVSAGFRRSVKPEILMPGGRQLYLATRPPTNGKTEFEPVPGHRPPGQLVAAPGRAMELDQTVHCRGTSNATAVASRAAARILARLDELRSDYADLAFSPADLAVLTKTLLVHGASWGDAGDVIEQLLARPTDDANERRRIKSRFLGFGEVDVNRCLFCTDQRVTVIGWGSLTKDSAHAYKFPLPQSLSAQRIDRRLTSTLAWLTPINPRHRDYRKASLWLSLPHSTFGADVDDLDHSAARRGTVFHRVFTGRHGRAFPDDAENKSELPGASRHFGRGDTLRDRRHAGSRRGPNASDLRGNSRSCAPDDSDRHRKFGSISPPSPASLP